MAEGWLRARGGDRVIALSAGTDPVGVSRTAIRVMAEVGVDLSSHRSESIGDHLDDPPDLVIAVCDDAARNCPALPGGTRVLRWPFPDPAAVRGSEEEVLSHFRDIRDRIGERLAAWIEEGLPPLFGGEAR
jgi:arsenate reductase (thioredoxin)